MKKGFTLLELIIVIIIIGILATLGFVQYTRVTEKGRTAEAKAILGNLRTAQAAWRLEYGAYAADITALATEVPTGCTVTHYFSYGTAGAVGTATRCIGATGKTPGGTTAYTVTVNYDTGVWGGTTGYF